MSEQTRMRGHDGFVTVEVEAETPINRLPDWLDLRAILRAAMDEYAKQGPSQPKEQDVMK